MKLSTEQVDQLRTALEDARDRLCQDCRNRLTFNMAGSHGFHANARKCKAEPQREALKLLEKK